MKIDFASERTNMVDSQVRTADVTDVAIQEAMRCVARERYAPGKAFLAYADTEVEFAAGRWLLRPRDVAKLLQALRPKSGESALALSAPYAAAVLRKMGLEVSEADAAEEESNAGRFDVVVCEGAVGTPPGAWLDCLAEGGRLGVVQREGPVGRAVLYLRAAETVGRRPLFDCTPPFMAGFEPAHAFTL